MSLNTIKRTRKNDRFKRLHGDVTRKEWAKEKREIRQEKKEKKQEKKKIEKKNNNKEKKKRKKKQRKLNLVQFIVSMTGKAVYFLKDENNRIKSCVPRYENGFPIKEQKSKKEGKKKKVKYNKRKNNNKRYDRNKLG